MLEGLIFKSVCTLLYSRLWLEEIFGEFFCQLKPTVLYIMFL